MGGQLGVGGLLHLLGAGHYGHVAPASQLRGAHLPMRGCSLSGRSMVLAMEMMKSCDPGRLGQSNRL